MSVGLSRLREEPDVIRKGAVDKGEEPALVDRALELDVERRRVQSDADGLRAKLKQKSAEVARALKANGDTQALRKEARDLGARIADRQARLETVESQIEDLLLRIPNPADPDVPIGGEEANVTVRTWGEQLAAEQPGDGEVGADAREGGSTWRRKPHWEIGETLDIIDNPRGAKIAGSGFPVYKGAGSALQRGLINWFLDVHTRENGMTEIWPPAVVNTDSARGTGQFPDKEDQMYASRATTSTWSRPPRCRSRTCTATRSSMRPPCRSTTPPTRPASGARRGRPARTRAGSFGCTSSTRSRWSSSSARRRRTTRSSG